MGEVAITFKVMPDGMEVDLGELKIALEDKLTGMCKIQGMKEEPVAFGLKAIVLQVIIEDAEGLLDKLEASLAEVPGVQNANMTEMGRLM